MALFGILKSMDPRLGNTGQDGEIGSIFAAPLGISSKQVSYVNDSITLRRVGFTTEAQRWEISAAISKTSNIENFLIAVVLKASTNYFYTRMPQIPHLMQGNEDNIEIAATGTFETGTDSVNLYHVLFEDRKIPPGMYIQFANHSKVYLVYDSEINGNSNDIKVFPKLTQPVVSGERIYYGSRVSMKSSFDTNTELGITFDDGILANVSSVRIVEKL